MGPEHLQLCNRRGVNILFVAVLLAVLLKPVCINGFNSFQRVGRDRGISCAHGPLVVQHSRTQGMLIYRVFNMPEVLWRFAYKTLGEKVVIGGDIRDRVVRTLGIRMSGQ